MNIIVKDIVDTCFGVDDFTKLNEVVLPLVEKNESNITLDFSDISMFSTRFFNETIGHYILTLSFEKYLNMFNIINMSELGKSIYAECEKYAIEQYVLKVSSKIADSLISVSIHERQESVYSNKLIECSVHMLPRKDTPEPKFSVSITKNINDRRNTTFDDPSCTDFPVENVDKLMFLYSLSDLKRKEGDRRPRNIVEFLHEIFTRKQTANGERVSVGAHISVDELFINDTMSDIFVGSHDDEYSYTACVSMTKEYDDRLVCDITLDGICLTGDKPKYKKYKYSFTDTMVTPHLTKIIKYMSSDDRSADFNTVDYIFYKLFSPKYMQMDVIDGLIHTTSVDTNSQSIAIYVFTRYLVSITCAAMAEYFGLTETDLLNMDKLFK